MIRIWFNHWFSTAYGIIELMKKDRNEDICIIGSNKNINSVIQKVCDEWFLDSPASGIKYIEFALDFCKEHKIDVFVPRRNMIEISKSKNRFEEIGVKVLLDDYEKIELLNDKARAYKFLKQIPSVSIPEFEVVNSYHEFLDAYKRLHESHEQICVKFVHDEGAMSYRRISEEKDSSDSIRFYPGAEISFTRYAKALKDKNTFNDLMVMEYLPGDEISVDCLNTSKGMIAIPRYKGIGRDEKIITNNEILKISREIIDKVKLDYPCNIQFKIKDNKPYLLEINTRMSGGIQMSCWAENINIPNIALNKLIGNEVDWDFELKERIVSYIEIPVIIA